jgi:hypothetical protein
MSRKKLARALGTCIIAIMIIVFITVFPSCDSQTPPTYGLQFDEVDDYVDCGNNATLDITGSITIEAWVKNTNPSLTQAQVIVSKDYVSGSTYKGYLLYINNGKFCMAVSDGSSRTLLQTSFNSTDWSHLVGAYDGEQIYLYINGVMVQSEEAVSSIQFAPFNLKIGVRAYASGQYFNGIMAEVRIWNISRSESEIQADMYKQLTGTESGLVAYWKFDEGSGTIAHDSTTNNNHGTLYGSPVWFTGGG